MGLYANTIFPHDMGSTTPLFEVSGSQVGITFCLSYVRLPWSGRSRIHHKLMGELFACYWNCWCDKTVTCSSDGMLVCHCFEMDGPKVHHLPLASEKMM